MHRARRLSRLGLVAVFSISMASTGFAQLFAVSGARGFASVLYEIDPADGQVIRVLGDTGLTHLTGLAFDPTSGELYAHRSPFNDSGQLYLLDIADATPTLIGATHITSSDLSFDATGNLYGWMEFHDGALGAAIDDLVTFNLQTGEATIVGESDVFPFQTGLSFDLTGELYLKSASDLYTVDVATGVPTLLMILSSAPENLLAFDEHNVAYTVDRRVDGTFLQTIDLSTGVVSDVGNIGVPAISAIAFSPSVAVSEPSAVFLWLGLAVTFAVGQLGLWWRRFQRRGRRTRSGEGPASTEFCRYGRRGEFA